MATDYRRISEENEKKYVTEVSYYGSDFADRYTERTHFIFELLQNAVDALRWLEEIHPGEHFAIESYVHPRSIGSRKIAAGQTLFYIPFDHDDIPAEQAFKEISIRLAKLGFRSLLFLKQIESVNWVIDGQATGSYIRDAR